MARGKRRKGDARSFDIVAELPPLEGPDEYKLEYIRSMVGIAADDIRHVTLFITVAFAVVLLLLTQVSTSELLRLPLWIRILLCAGLATLIVSALFFFRYVRKLHITRMKMVRCIPTLQVERVRELWAGEAGVWQQYKGSYRAGQVSLGMGVVLIAIVVAYLFLSSNLDGGKVMS